MRKPIEYDVRKRLFRHMTAAPKGLLRYYALELLSEEPRSGSDIMDLIEEHSSGLWRPSPGSIYPLLEWLRDKGYIKEIQYNQANIKKYTLTEKGRKFLEEQRRIKLLMMKSLKFFAPYFLDSVFFRAYGDEHRGLFREFKSLIQMFFSLEAGIREKDNKEYIELATAILKDASSRLEELKKKMEMNTNE